MNYIQFAIQNPVKVAVGVLLLLLFGFIALVTIPIQLTPNVDQPIITIQTSWVGRSPEEVEREILEEQEDKLKGVANLEKMTAVAEQGSGTITLEFLVGTNMDRALQEASDKLREVPDYPDEVDEPVITAADSASENAIAWLSLTSSDPDVDVQGMFDMADKRIKPILDRVPGVGEINIYGGREHQVHIQVDPRALAQRGITFNQLAQALRQENVNVSAGEITDGRLDVRVRTLGQYDAIDEVRRTIVAYTPGGPVRVDDLADVVLTLEKRRSFVRSRGEPALAFQVTRETGSNVMEVMAVLRREIDYVNEQLLPNVAPSLKLTQLYDETDYIDDAINLVQSNLVVGGLLAAGVLLLFLRTVRPTLIIALAIPISTIGTFVVMTATGRNLNVISLAGLAFAVGMVVDAAIVVLENIDRHLLMGKRPALAAYDGTREVWGAVLASALTTVAVFLPVVFMAEEAGQLFRDIAIALCAAVTLSLIVAVTVIPSASARFLRTHHEQPGSLKARARNLLGLASVAGWIVNTFANGIHWLTGRTAARTLLRVAIVAGFTFAAIGGSWLIMPPTTYLPKGNQNLVFGVMLNPPGYSIEQNETIAHRLEAKVKPYWQSEGYDPSQPLPPVLNPMTRQPIVNIPPIDNLFVVAFRGAMFMGASSADKNNVAPLGDLLTSTMWSIPGTYGFAQQTSLFGRGLGGTNSIDVEVTASDLDRLRDATQAIEQRLSSLGQVQPDPGNYALPGPELQVSIDRVQAADLGVDVASLGLGVQALVDGAVIGDYRYEGDSIDLLLTRDPRVSISPETIGAVPLATAGGDGSARATGVVPLSAVATMKRAPSPQSIKRIEQRRAITLSVTPPGSVPLETAMNQIDSIVASMRAEGVLGGDVEVQLAGTADKLTQVRTAMLGSWDGWSLQSLQSVGLSRLFLALLVTYLLMAALFESFLYPAVIMFSVPLSAVGGFAGLAIVHHFIPDQQLDVLTMLGFIILIGTVVNNAILIIHQSLNYMRGFGESAEDVIEAMTPRDAIRESVRTRIRPIFMTTATTVCGMLPLVLMPGPGSELYRGLGSVVLGGLIVSTLFTLIVVPLLFSLVLDAKRGLYGLLSWQLPETEAQQQMPEPA